MEAFQPSNPSRLISAPTKPPGHQPSIGTPAESSTGTHPWTVSPQLISVISYRRQGCICKMIAQISQVTAFGRKKHRLRADIVSKRSAEPCTCSSSASNVTKPLLYAYRQSSPVCIRVQLTFFGHRRSPLLPNNFTTPLLAVPLLPPTSSTCRQKRSNISWMIMETRAPPRTRAILARPDRETGYLQYQ